MKRFLVNVFFFCSLTLTIVFLFGSIPVSDDYIIHKTKNTSFGKIAWNLSLINRHPEFIEGSSIFMGSSLMLSGISDSLLNTKGIPAINFAINGTGHEVILFFLERILPHKPGKIYLHLFKNDKSGLHNMTPLLYTPTSLLAKGQSFNFEFIKFLFKRFYFVVDYGLWKLKGAKKQNDDFSLYGTVYRDDIVLTGDKYKGLKKEITDDYFESFNLQRNNFLKKKDQGKQELYLKGVRSVRRVLYSYWTSEFIFNCESQSGFASRSLALCKSNTIETYRLYIPMVTDAKINKDFDSTFYIPRNGNENIISLKNFNSLDSTGYWADLAHLSRRGAFAFTNRIAGEVLIRK